MRYTLEMKLLRLGELRVVQGLPCLVGANEKFESERQAQLNAARDTVSCISTTKNNEIADLGFDNSIFISVVYALERRLSKKWVQPVTIYTWTLHNRSI